jgi:hypothetical protein
MPYTNLNFIPNRCDRRGLGRVINYSPKACGISLAAPVPINMLAPLRSGDWCDSQMKSAVNSDWYNIHGMAPRWGYHNPRTRSDCGILGNGCPG